MNKSVKVLMAVSLAAALAAASIGCDGSPEADRPKTYGVTGTVMYNGAPIEGASVTFVPVGDGKSAAGFTNASGQYTLTTFTAGDGAVAGKYNVKISKMAQPEAAAPTAAPASSAGVEVETGYEPGAEDVAAAPPTNLLPAKYADANTSGLAVEVVEGENPPQDFKLEG